MTADIVDHGLLSPVWAGAPAGSGCDDIAVVQAMLDVEHAWAQVCVEAGLITDAAPTATAWQAGTYDVAGLARRAVAGGNPLIPLLADLRQALSDQGFTEAAAGVHLGATSQDVLDTALMLLSARTLADVVPTLDAAADALAELSSTHRATPCLARTLGQAALPTTFGARTALWLGALSNAAGQLTHLRSHLPVQWAGAAGTSAALVQRLSGSSTGAADLRAELAARLDLADHPGWQADRAPMVRLGAALAEVCSATGKFGTDVVTGSRAEIGELAEPVAAGRGGSSAMPHKRNPVLSVLLRSAALSAPGQLATLGVAAGTAADERADGAWHAQWSALRELLRLACGSAYLASELAAGLSVDTDAMRRHLQSACPGVLSERIVAVTSLILAEQDPDTAARGRGLIAAALADSRAAPDPSAPMRAALRGLLPPGTVEDLLDPTHYLGQAAELADDAVRRHRARTSTNTSSAPHPPVEES